MAENVEELGASSSGVVVALDTYVLGQGTRTGVYRVCDELFRRLARRNDLDIRFLLRSKFQAESRKYLQDHNMYQGIVDEFELNPSTVADILVSPFGVAPASWQADEDVLHAHIIYDIIAIRRPDLFTPEASAEVHAIVDSLTSDTLVFTISEYTRNDLLDYRPDLSPNQVVVIPLAASQKFVPCEGDAEVNRVKTRYGISAEAPYVLSLATLEVRKNLNCVVDAFARYLDEHPASELNLVLAGMSGWKLDKLRESLAGSRRWRDRIILTGFVDEADLAPLYSGAECFLYLSQYEGFGLPPLEALACGTPVICADNSSLPEVVGDAGILVDAHDSRATTEALSQILASRQMRLDLSRKGLARAKLFSWDRCEQIVVESLKQFARAARRGTPTGSEPPFRSSSGLGTRQRRRNAPFLHYEDGQLGPRFGRWKASPAGPERSWPQWTDTLPRANNVRAEGGRRTFGQFKSGTLGSPLVSYVTVVRNGQQTLERAILSVQAQTYSNVEHIILDGASSDGTLEIISRYRDKLDYFVSEPDRGLYDALNKAIPLCRGQLICVLNADDWLEPDAALVAVSLSKDRGGPLMVLTAAQVADQGAKHIWKPAAVHPGSYFTCANDCHNAIYAGRAVYEMTGPYDSSYRIAADFKWIMAALDVGADFVYSGEATVNYTLGGASSDVRSHSHECMRVVKDRFPYLATREIRGLYHCFFVFSGIGREIGQDVPPDRTKFLQQILVEHADRAEFVESLAWASMTKFTYPGQQMSTLGRKKTGMKIRLANTLRNYPFLFRLARWTYHMVRKG